MDQHRADGDLALADMRHRMAQSLQLVATLIAFRLRRTEGAEARDHLAWLLDVVTALGLLQQRLEMAGRDGIASYLRDAGAFWSRLSAGRGIRIRVHADSITLPDAQMAALALIAHELVANSLAHAFPDGCSGTIAIGLHRISDDMAELIVKDDGRGLVPAAGRHGLALLEALAGPLGATIEIDGTAGTIATVRFPIASARPGNA